MDDEVATFGRLFQQFMERMGEAATRDRGSELREILHAHLGTEADLLPVVSESHPPYDHVNVQVAMTAYLEEGRTHERVGLAGHQRHYGSLSDLLQVQYGLRIRRGAVDLVRLPSGPDQTLDCVQFGFFLISDGHTPLGVLMRGPEEHSPQEAVTLEVLSPDPQASSRFLAEIRRLMLERNVFRGKVISFGESHMGYSGLGPVVFRHRPQVAKDRLVFAPGVLELVEGHVFGIARHQNRLRASGQHVKRGLLLHGPPGCGKTLTVRYLISHVRDHTVLLLTGGGLHMVRTASALARMLQPALIVLEDVDLVAEERGTYPGHSSVLFDLLNEMDGVAEDADVAFVLTTNRADLLEPALAARPGRVDLAVEIPLPDEDGRRRLIELYAEGLDLRLAGADVIVSRTRGVTASFVKELVRKAALIAAEHSGGKGAVTVTDAELTAALDELLAERSSLTRILLGGTSDRRATPRPPRPGTDWMVAGDGGEGREL